MQGATYNQLVIFQAIVHEGSIRGAARKLEMAPPSVSQTLKLLESNIGLSLFNRTTRKIELTDAGKLLYERTLEAMSSLNYALESVHELSAVPSGHLRLTLPRFAYNGFVKDIYADFCRLYPEIQLELIVSDATVDLVKEGIDVGIRFGDRIEEGMVARQLTQPLVEPLFASSEYIQHYGEPITLTDLQHHKMIQYRFITSNQLAPLELKKNDQTVRLTTEQAVIVNDTDVIIDAALKGLGIGPVVVPDLNTFFTQYSLKPILSEHWVTQPALYVYFTQHSQKVRRVRVLIDFLLERITIRENG